MASNSGSAIHGTQKTLPSATSAPNTCIIRSLSDVRQMLGLRLRDSPGGSPDYRLAVPTQGAASHAKKLTWRSHGCVVQTSQVEINTEFFAIILDSSTSKRQVNQVSAPDAGCPFFCLAQQISDPRPRTQGWRGGLVASKRNKFQTLFLTVTLHIPAPECKGFVLPKAAWPVAWRDGRAGRRHNPKANPTNQNPQINNGADA